MKRITYFDYLRIISCFAVILLHTAATLWWKADDTDFIVCTIYDAAGRYGVPVFTMISGALFLEPNIPVKKIWTKHTPKIAIAYIVWSTVYALRDNTKLQDIIVNSIRGPIHLWFLPMIATLYVITPLLRLIAKNEKTLRYFLVFSLIFAFLIPSAINYGKFFGSPDVVEISKAFEHLFNNAQIRVDYAAYFMLGYYLHKTELTKKQRYLIYGLGILGAITTIMLTLKTAEISEEPQLIFFRNMNPNILLQSVPVFVLFKQLKLKDSKVIRAMSKYSFGVYLMHMLIMKDLVGTTLRTYSVAIAIPLITIICFVLSFAVVAGYYSITAGALKLIRSSRSPEFNNRAATDFPSCDIREEVPSR